MPRAILITFFTVALFGCSGTLVYHSDEKIHHTTLEERDPNTVKSTGVLANVSNGFRNPTYAITSDGAYTGVCIYRGVSEGSAKTDLSIFALRTKIISMDHIDIAKAIDSFENNSLYKSIIIDDPNKKNHFGCVEMGAASDGPYLVIRLQPNVYEHFGGGENPDDVILKVDVRKKSFDILDMERIPRTMSPTRIFPVSNSGAGRISDANGVVNIDNKPVLLNNKEIPLDEIDTNQYYPIKHHFD